MPRWSVGRFQLMPDSSRLRGVSAIASGILAVLLHATVPAPVAAQAPFDPGGWNNRLGKLPSTMRCTLSRWECESFNEPARKAEALKFAQMLQANARSPEPINLPGENRVLAVQWTARHDGESARILAAQKPFQSAGSWFTQQGYGVRVSSQDRILREAEGAAACHDGVIMGRLMHSVEPEILKTALRNIETASEPDAAIPSPILGLPLCEARIRADADSPPSARHYIATGNSETLPDVELVQVLGLPNGGTMVTSMAFHRPIGIGETQRALHSEFTQIAFVRDATGDEAPITIPPIDARVSGISTTHVRVSDFEAPARIPDGWIHPQPHADFVAYADPATGVIRNLADPPRIDSLYEIEALNFFPTDPVSDGDGERSAVKDPAGPKRGPKPSTAFGWALAGLLASVLVGVVAWFRGWRKPSAGALAVLMLTCAAPASADPCGADWTIPISELRRGSPSVELPGWLTLPPQFGINGSSTFKVRFQNDLGTETEITKIDADCWCLSVNEAPAKIPPGEGKVASFRVIDPGTRMNEDTWSRQTVILLRIGNKDEAHHLTIVGTRARRACVISESGHFAQEEWGNGGSLVLANPDTAKGAELLAAEIGGTPVSFVPPNARVPFPESTLDYPITVPAGGKLRLAPFLTTGALRQDGELVARWRSGGEQWEQRVALHSSAPLVDAYIAELLSNDEEETSGSARVRIARRDGQPFRIRDCSAGHLMRLQDFNPVAPPSPAHTLTVLWDPRDYVPNFGRQGTAQGFRFGLLSAAVQAEDDPCPVVISGPVVVVRVPPKPPGPVPTQSP